MSAISAPGVSLGEPAAAPANAILARHILRIVAPHAAVLVFFTVLSVWQTWPLARDMRGHMMEKEDVYMNVWHLHWMRQALWENPQNPFESPLLHHPMGAELYWHTLSPAKTAWGVPLLAFMRAETAYNLLIFTTFILAGYTAWLLCRYLLRRAKVAAPLANLAAVAGACAFTFSPYHFAQASAHLNLAAIEGIPLYVYCFLRWLDEGRPKLLIGLAASVLYVVWCDFYYLYYVALFSALWMVADRWQRGSLLSFESWKDVGLRRSAIAAGVAALACLPAAAPLLLHLTPEPLQIHHGDSDYYVDLVGLAVPDVYSAWLDVLPNEWGQRVTWLSRARMASNTEESGYWLGYLVPLLCVVALLGRVPHGRRWLGIGAVFLILACGTFLSINGDRQHSPVVLLIMGALLAIAIRRPTGATWRRLDILALLLMCIFVGINEPFTAFGVAHRVEIPMPYVVFKSVVPLFGRGGMPVRFEFMVTLVMSVLVAFAAARVAAAPWRRHVGFGVVAVMVVVAAVNLDYRRKEMKLFKLPPIPVIFDEIAREPGVAVSTDGVRGQWEQLYHLKPVTWARQSRLPLPEYDYEKSPLLQALHYRRCPAALPDAQRDEMRAFLTEHRIRYHVAHALRPNCDRFIREVLGGQLVEANPGQYWVYRFDYVPTGRDPGAARGANEPFDADSGMRLAER